jgi:transcriptional regulator with XRE-family HTH domain
MANDESTFRQLAHAFRVVKRLSQSDLAQRVGASATTIQRVEAGELPATPELRRKIARALGMPTAFGADE